jgi:hypothetical protein
VVIGTLPQRPTKNRAALDRMANEMPVNYSIELPTCDVAALEQSAQFRVFRLLFPL